LDPSSSVARHDYEVVLRTTLGTSGDSDVAGGLTPEPGTTAQPAPSATPGVGTPQPGPGDPTGTPQPGPTQAPDRSAGSQELESRIAALDALIQSLQDEDGDLSYEETLELLELLAERNRLSELLESIPGASNPDNR
jgi:hypothetical protein